MIILIATIAISYCIIRLLLRPFAYRNYYGRVSCLWGLLEAQKFVDRSSIFNRRLIEKMLLIPVLAITFLIPSSNHLVQNLDIFVLLSMLLIIIRHILTIQKPQA